MIDISALFFGSKEITQLFMNIIFDAIISFFSMSLICENSKYFFKSRLIFS